MTDQKYRLEWAADRSIRYHDRRRAFYENVEATASAFTLIAGSFAVISILKDFALIAGIFSAVTAIAGFFQIVLRPAQMAGEHVRLKQLFTDLRIDIENLDGQASPGDFKKLESQRLKIERDEPVIYRLLDLICHNELALAQGIRPEDGAEDLYDIGWFKKLTANFWHWETTSIKSLAEKKRTK